MSTNSVCQGLQSCLEPGLTEARVLRLKLALPKDSAASNSPETGRPQARSGLSFLQALAKPSGADAGQAVYVHPMVRRSASMLSARSLEMCTEGLGSETGSGDGEMSLLSMESGAADSPPRQGSRPRAMRMDRSASFPPPLASAGLKVRPHREDGRLVLRAVVVSSSSSCFHAERADGRLRLRLLNSPPNRDVEGEEKEEEEEEEMGEEEGIESEVKNEDYEEEEEEEENGDEEEETEEGLRGGGVEERNGNVGVKNGKEKLQSYSRCKEDGCGNNNRPLLNCNQQYMVAT